MSPNSKPPTIARIWLQWFSDLARGVHDYFDHEASQAFDAEPVRDWSGDIETAIAQLPAGGRRNLEGEIRELVDALRNPVTPELAAAVDELRARLVTDPPGRPDPDQIQAADAARDYDAQLEELSRRLASIREFGGEVPAHAPTHQNGGTDEVATTTAAAGAIPKAGTDGTLAAAWRVLDRISLTNQSASMAATPLGGAPAPAGQYRVTWHTACRTAGTGNVATTISWNDGISAKTSSGTISLGAGAFQSIILPLMHADGANNITAAAAYTGTGAFDFYVTLERVS